MVPWTWGIGAWREKKLRVLTVVDPSVLVALSPYCINCYSWANIFSLVKNNHTIVFERNWCSSSYVFNNIIFLSLFHRSISLGWQGRLEHQRRQKWETWLWKNFLGKNGVNVELFKTHWKLIHFTERKKKENFGGKITTPVPSTSAVIRETLRQKITNGKYLLEEVIAPKSCQKLTIDSNGSLTKEYFSERQKKLFWTNKAESTTRTWGDGIGGRPLRWTLQGMTNEELEKHLRDNWRI